MTGSKQSWWFGTFLFLLQTLEASHAKFNSEFQITSNNPCLQYASLVEYKHEGEGEACQQPGVVYCAPKVAQGRNATTLHFNTHGVPVAPPSFEFLLINACQGDQPVLVQKFAFGLELYSPDDPFAISRSLCPGMDALFSDDSCCVFNLCNGVFGKEGICENVCGKTTISLKYKVEWSHENNMNT
eukprot:m.2899 g.2899  ORF g.2899 m.2899 type:complete len:185 (+) comp2613_c0_seq2:188-742(+)